MVLSHFGMIAAAEWRRTGRLRVGTKAGLCVVMPNHLHGVLLLTADRDGQVAHPSRSEAFGKPMSRSVPTIVRAFKAAVTRRINAARDTPGAPVWQRDYYEHVIRDEDELGRVYDYIMANPAQWEFDRENPEHGAPLTPGPFQ